MPCTRHANTNLKEKGSDESSETHLKAKGGCDWTSRMEHDCEFLDQTTSL